jgi:hypothetical protein
MLPCTDHWTLAQEKERHEAALARKAASEASEALKAERGKARRAEQDAQARNKKGGVATINATPSIRTQTRAPYSIRR